MPLLFYGSLGSQSRRRLYSPGPREIEVSIFDSYKVEDLAPYDDLTDHRNAWAVANFWHFPKKKHCAIAWHSEHSHKEQLIWIPSLLSRIDALYLAREEFGSIVPSAIIFRFNNENEIYEYV